MSALWVTWIAVGIAGLAALAYWQLVIAEGTYLGARFVARTYDWIASRYDAIKQFNPRDEDWFVAAPLVTALASVDQPLVLDVATGTGRLPVALLRNHYAGQIVGLDLSQGMLRQAAAKLRHYGDRVHLVWQDAACLPFSDGTFDAVTSLESLEFLPDPRGALAEMVRVLTPGGVLFLSNRVGSAARLLPARALSRAAFARLLADLPLAEVQIQRWQVSYDLAFARKEGFVGRRDHGGAGLAKLLRCPACAGNLEQTPSHPQQAGQAPGGLSCAQCDRHYPIQEGIVHLAIRKAQAGG
jgi:ubiquinone/menaquinone biosynthesis C-methylase UbiE/uncharacterized protein YbaR (Trm112 family)